VLQAQNQNLVVTVKNVQSDKGKIGVAVYNEEGEFMKKHWKVMSVVARTGDVQVVFENIPAGVYAISVMHDENENGELDSNFMGMPKEGFGFSNDAMGMFGPPSFEKAKFKHPAQPPLVITLKYL
jgi:uncharacterized protein (DUF2141 family)